MAQHVGQGVPHPDRATLLSRATALVDYLTAVLPPTAGTAPAYLDAAEDLQPPRTASVLVPIYARDGYPHLLFTRRSPALSLHSGQISFPGGSQDPGDDSLATTALREAYEELGIVPDQVQVVGALTTVFTVVSNFLITPIVGWLGEGPIPLVPNPTEVAEVIEAPLAALADPAIFHAEMWERAGLPHPVYFYDFGPYRIWGATARVLHELLGLLPG